MIMGFLLLVLKILMHKVPLDHSCAPEKKFSLIYTHYSQL